MWLLYAIDSAFFGVTSIFGKVGVKNVDANLAFLVRTFVVFIIMTIIILCSKKYKDIKKISKKSYLFLLLSVLSTSASWYCYFLALKNNDASVIFTVEKLSIVFSTSLAFIFLKEKINIKIIAGLILIVTGTLILLVNI